MSQSPSDAPTAPHWGVEVVFSQHMVAPMQPGLSPSAAKPAAVVAAWQAAFPDLRLIPPCPASTNDLCRAHDPDYVRDVLDLVLPNGFGTFDAQVTATLPYTSGAMLTAARRAMATRRPVAAPCSGFHHACWAHGGGFCTFNGLMVTALALQAEQPGTRVGILDYDYHYGNGTDEIIDHLHCKDVVHITAGLDWLRETQAKAFLAAIPDHLDQLSSCDIVLYQAGADPHIDDPLGGFLTTAQMAMRDWRVFDGLARRGVPVAWNLAGGYQRPIDKVVKLHVNTMRFCIESLSVQPETADASTRLRTTRRVHHGSAV